MGIECGDEEAANKIFLRGTSNDTIHKVTQWFNKHGVKIISLNIINASGGYDNGTSIGKGNVGIDLTWNPFNYWPKGQSYIVLSYNK